MRLYIVRDSSSAESRFAVYDSCENVVFTVKGKRTRAGDRLRVYDSTEKCVIKIAAIPRIGGVYGYNIVTDSSVFALTLKLSKGSIRPKIHGIPMFICGEILTGAYSFTDVSTKVLGEHKPTPGKPGSHTLTVTDSESLLNLLSVAICTGLLSFSDSAVVCRA